MQNSSVVENIMIGNKPTDMFTLETPDKNYNLDTNETDSHIMFDGNESHRKSYPHHHKRVINLSNATDNSKGKKTSKSLSS